MGKVFDNPITLNTDWGGDASTGNLPVSGRRVQELIKNTFAKKGGCVQIKDKKFLQIFADEASMKKYNSDTEKYEDLVISQVQLPNTGATQATMKNTIFVTPSEYTTAGSAETFKFKYLSYYENEEDLSQVSGSCTVYVAGTQRERITLRSGNTYTIDVTKYIGEDVTEIRFTIDNAEGSSRSYVYEVTMVNLMVSSSFDSVTAYEGVIPFVYTPIGNIKKTVHIILDGKEIHQEETDVNNRQQTFDIPAQAHGAHSLEVYLSASVQGSELESNHLNFALVCIEQGNETPIIASTMEHIYMKQYETVSIPFVVYDPLNNPADIALKINDAIVATRKVDRTQQSWVYKAMSQGDATMTITCRSVSKTFPLAVDKSSITSEAETQNLELFLTSQGRSNQDTDRETWENNGIAASFSEMNYITNGWIVDKDGNTAMRLSGGAAMTIPLKLFSKDIRQTGKTIEIEFAVRQVMDYEGVVLSCQQGGIGLRLTPNTISLTSEQSTLETKYKEDERVRVSFVVEKRANNRLMQIYINGIKSQSLQYPANDGFVQPSPVDITVVSSTATIDIYNIRSYSNNLNAQQLLDNYIADMDDIDKKLAIFNRNQVYDTYGNLSYSKMLEQIPCLIITGELSQFKGDKKTVSIEYVDKNHPEKSFTADGVVLNVQGTSSQYYPRKNYKGQFKKGFNMTESGKHQDMFTLNEEAVLPAANFCWKADFAESSGTHNTGLANYIGWMLLQAGILTEPQKKNALIRTTVYGEPCLIFHRSKAGDTPLFIGKYNFNTDKSAENTFGFAEGDESWEFLNNTSDRSNFRSADFSDDGWKHDFESRYPDGNEDISHMREVFTWVVSCKDDIEKFKAEFAEHFDKKTIIFYYIITLVFGMVDQRAKNQFLTFYVGGKWIFIFYDNDTVFGINNEGAIQFSYDIEIHDIIGNLNVWNGANSLLWELVEQAFSSDITKMYQDLRQKGILSYDKIIEFCNTRQSDKWCESVYNEDGYFKYESPLIDGYTDYSTGTAQTVKTGAFLYALQGSRDAHRRWWLYNRFKYMDSKFQAGSSLSDYITFRTYTPSVWVGVEPKADITIGAFSAMYGTIRWGSVTKSERMREGEVKTITAPAGIKFNDTETIIYNASMIKTIGDLSALYVGTVDVSKATNITELIIGSSKAGYQNQNFSVLSLGNNAKLRKLDIQNCPNYTTSIDVSGCENIEEVYAKGTKATAVNLAEGGVLRILELPATITNLTLKNQPKLGTGLSVDSWANVTTLVIENCPNIEPLDIAEEILFSDNALVYVRFTNIDALKANFSILSKLSNIKGVGDNGEYTSIAYLSGKYTVLKATEEDIERVKSIFPHLTITARTVLKTIFATFNVVSQYGAIKGATVEINDLTYDLSSGTVKVPLAEGERYDYVIRYSGGEDRGTIQSRSDTTISKSYNIEFDIMTMKPEPNGKMQVLLTGNSVSITASGGSVNIDWGDGSTSNEGSHTYTDGNAFHNVSLDSVEEKNAQVTFGEGNIVAFWTVGNTPIGVSTLIEQNKLEYVSEDVCLNSLDIGGFFYGCYKLKEIPKSVFISNGDSTTLNRYKNYERGLFSHCYGLKSIPVGLFDNFKNVEKSLNTFESCSIESVPRGLFDKMEKLTSIDSDSYGYGNAYGTFTNCSSLKEVPFDIFDKNPIEVFHGTFKDTKLSVGLLPVSLKSPAAAHNTVYSGCPIEKIIGRTETPATINSYCIPERVLKIYVPDSAIETYKAATNWNVFADKIVGWSELTEEERQKYGLTI